MAIEFDCGQCGKPLFAQEQFAGRPIKCPACGQTMNIPSPAAVPGPGPAPSPQAPAAAPVAVFRTIPPGSLSVSDLVTIAFQAYSKNVWLGAGLNLIALAWNLAALALILFWGPATTWQQHLAPGYLALIFSVWTVESLVMTGLLWVGVKMSDQAIGVPVPPTAADFFAPLSHPIAVLCAWFPLLVCRELGTLLCQALLPGTGSTAVLAPLALMLCVHVVYFTRFFMAVPLILDRKLGALDAMRESLRITSGHGAVILGVMVLAAVSYLVGSFLCLIGVVFSAPFGQCLIGALYRNLAVQK